MVSNYAAISGCRQPAILQVSRIHETQSKRGNDLDLHPLLHLQAHDEEHRERYDCDIDETAQSFSHNPTSQLRVVSIIHRDLTLGPYSAR